MLRYNREHVRVASVHSRLVQEKVWNVTASRRTFEFQFGTANFLLKRLRLKAVGKSCYSTPVETQSSRALPSIHSAGIPLVFGRHCE